MNKLFAIILMVSTLLFVSCSSDSDNGVNPTQSDTPQTDIPDTPQTDIPDTPQTDIPDTPQTDIPESSHEVVGVWSCEINKQLLTSFGLTYDSITVVTDIGKYYDFTLEVISNDSSIFNSQGKWNLSPNEDTLVLAGDENINFQLPIDIENNTWSISLANLIEIAPALGIDPAANPLLITIANKLSLTFTRQN